MQKLMHPLKRLGEIKLGPQNTADLSFCTYRVLRTVAHYFYEAENVSKIRLSYHYPCCHQAVATKLP